MPWKETKVVDQRKEFISDYLDNELDIAKLAKKFNISRPTVYKWIQRYEKEGIDGLEDKIRARRSQPLKTSKEIEEAIIAAKLKRRSLGPKKVLARLQRDQPEVQWPCKTTVENILKKHGLVELRKLRKRFAERTNPLAHCQQSNDIWTADFKGWSLTKDGYKYGPFTLMDADSRFLIACTALSNDNTEYVWSMYERAFLEYGLPLRLRSDNGPPFASKAPGRLSKLAIRLIKAGVVPEWIDPGQPQQNGRHERMHLTLKHEGVFPDLTLAEQQTKAIEFLEFYNYERPHEALGLRCPADVYEPSPRAWNGRLQSPDYPDHYQIGKVKSCGKMSWRGGEVYIGRVLENEPIGIEENEDGLIAYYGPIQLGRIITKQLEVPRRKGRIRNGKK